ncbi:MAG: PEPxxWA-CTERM sorting domain-containing protein [Sphingomonas sp.]
MRFDAMAYRTGFLALAIGGMTATSAQAQSFSYADFANTTGLMINGAATSLDIAGRDVMRLTPPQGDTGGSMFSTQAIALTNDYSFSTRFTFTIGSNHQTQFGEIGADGIAFVVQTQSNNVGGLGGGLGYAGINPSVEIEFDPYSNGGSDPRLPGSGALNGNDHIAIMANGDPANHLAYQIVSPTLELDGGQDITAFVDYNGATNLMEVRWSIDGLRPSDAGLSYSMDLASLFGTNPVYVGFTASTGADWSAQDIVNWTFNSNYDPITTAPTGTIPAGSPSGAVPEPAAWAMMIAGFGAVGGATRRKRRQSLRYSLG